MNLITTNHTPFNLFNEFFGVPCRDGDCVDFMSRTDIVELTEGYRISIDLPGVNKDDISVEVNDGLLKIVGERVISGAAEGEKTIHSERTYGKFERTFRLSNEIDKDSITANYNDGVLVLGLNKSENILPKRIPISN